MPKRSNAVRKPVAGSGPRCCAPGCGKPMEQNSKILINPKDPDDVRHFRCAPASWKDKAFA